MRMVRIGMADMIESFSRRVEEDAPGRFPMGSLG